MRDKIKLALETDTREFDKEIKAYFKENKDVYIYWAGNDINAFRTALASLDDIEVILPLEELSLRLSRWLTPFNDVYIKSSTDVFYNIAGLQQLNVGLIDFSSIRLNNTNSVLLRDS